MDAKKLQITLVPAPDDLPEQSDEYQAELRSFDDTLKEEGLDPSSRVLLIEAAGHEVTPLLGVFNVALSSSLSALSVAGGDSLRRRSLPSRPPRKRSSC